MAAVGILLIGLEMSAVDYDSPASSEALTSMTLTEWLAPAIVEIEQHSGRRTDLETIWYRLVHGGVPPENEIAQAARRLGKICASVKSESGGDTRCAVKRAVQDFVTLFDAGWMDFAERDRWFGRRAALHHNDLGVVASVWGDPSRRVSLYRYLLWPKLGWSEESRNRWLDSFRRWPGVKESLLAMTAVMEEEFRPLHPAEELLAGKGWQAELSIVAARRYFARLDRHEEWRVAVRDQVGTVNSGVAKAAPSDTKPKLEKAAFDRERRRGLDQLASSITELRNLVGAEEYFNHGKGD